METAPDMRMLCMVVAGIQIANCVGISQKLWPAETSITPRVA
jgi:hypothetical protein